MAHKFQFKQICVEEWTCLLKFYADHEENWIFRGQEDDWQLRTSLERVCGSFTLTNDIREIERKLIRDFKRRYFTFSSNSPADGDTLEWLALIQHHGAPTRLLDWTYSFFAAAYFALEKPGSTPTIWAINTDWLHSECKKILKNMFRGVWLLKEHINKRTPRSFDSLFMKNRAGFVFRAVPFRLNDRLSAQQGSFLCPGDISIPFEDNLSVFTNCTNYIIQLSIQKDMRQDFLRRLSRMNVHGSALFPDLSGFAQSFRTRVLMLDSIPDKI